jgi:hypothetical protein
VCVIVLSWCCWVHVGVHPRTHPRARRLPAAAGVCCVACCCRVGCMWWWMCARARRLPVAAGEWLCCRLAGCWQADGHSHCTVQGLGQFQRHPCAHTCVLTIFKQ